MGMALVVFAALLFFQTPGLVLSLGLTTTFGFYNQSCPKAESIIQSVMSRRFALDRTIPAGLLRMLFHDAFVTGADASVLLNSTSKMNLAERDARPNLSLRGFDVVEEAKAAVEAVCPGVVSCADILPLLVRDGIALAGGPRYDVPTGRHDSLFSRMADTDILPDPAFPVTQAREAFFQRGLNYIDFVTLLGGHTIGSSLCGFFSDRMFNYHGTGAPDPGMNVTLAKELSVACPNPFFTESRADPLVSLDQGTPDTFDTSYYHQILTGNGILAIDAALAEADEPTMDLVRRFSTSRRVFFAAFVRSIVKLSNLGVLTGTQGQIRKVCHAVNPSPSPRRLATPKSTPKPKPKPKSKPTSRSKAKPIAKPKPKPKPSLANNHHHHPQPSP